MLEIQSKNMVMVRKLTLLLALWAFVLSMPLCASGVVLHLCDPCQTACPHDATCSQDPCSFKVLQSDSASSFAHVHLDLITLLPLWFIPTQLAVTPQRMALLSAAVFPPHAQSYPLGAFPLLI
jgi:hypothetical protein